MTAGRDLSRPPPAAGRRFQVLSLSGGGVRGLYTACVLEGLEARAGCSIGECFDLVAGTSIGGIIALGLALGRSAAEVRAIIEDAGPAVFPRGRWRSVAGLFRARYAQPVPLRNHSAAIPAILTPIPGLFFASMSQVYPWDRGTNYAVELGRRAAGLLMEDHSA